MAMFSTTIDKILWFLSADKMKMSHYFSVSWYPLELGNFFLFPNFELFQTETWDFICRFKIVSTSSLKILRLEAWTIRSVSELQQLNWITLDTIMKMLASTVMN